MSDGPPSGIGDEEGGIATVSVHDPLTSGELQREKRETATALGTGRRVLISGATGLIGSALRASLLNDHFSVVALTTRLQGVPGVSSIQWDPDANQLDPEQLSEFDVVIHLAGESIFGRWTQEKKRRIERSRIDSTILLTKSLAKARERPAVLIVASAVGFYGNRGTDVLPESAARGATGFLPFLAFQWEFVAAPVKAIGIRVVNLRFGIVLSKNGGALKLMLPIFKAAIGGRLGSGRQYMSWITLDDAINVIRFAMNDDTMSGPVNVVSPNPVTNAEFTRTVARVLHRPAVIPVPDFALRLLFGKMADETLLVSTRAVPEQLENHGFQFSDPVLEPALRRILEKPDL